MGQVQQLDAFTPIVSAYEALVPYVVLSAIVGLGFKAGLQTLGQVLGRRRPGYQAVLGLVFSASNLLFLWVLYVAFLLRPTEVTGQASVDATAQRLEGTPELVKTLAQTPGGTLVEAAAGLLLVFVLGAGCPERRARA